MDALGRVQQGQPDPDDRQFLPGRNRGGHGGGGGVQAVAGVSRDDGKRPVKISGDFGMRCGGQRVAVLFGSGDPLACNSQEVTERRRHRRKPGAGRSASPPLRRHGTPACLATSRLGCRRARGRGRARLRPGDRVRYLVRIRAGCRVATSGGQRQTRGKIVLIP